MVVGPRHFDAPLERALPIRKGANYQHRRNYEGHYWCAGSRSHVWYESMTEYSALMYLDHTLEIAELSSQPACVYFDDGSRHYPDFFARLKSGKRIMFDVRPVDLIDDVAVEQFSKTASVCEQIGWQYEVVHGLTGVPRYNLEWLAAYRHSWNSPPPAVGEAMPSYLSEPMTLGL